MTTVLILNKEKNQIISFSFTTFHVASVCIFITSSGHQIHIAFDPAKCQKAPSILLCSSSYPLFPSILTPLLYSDKLHRKP